MSKMLGSSATTQQYFHQIASPGPSSSYQVLTSPTDPWGVDPGDSTATKAAPASLAYPGLSQ